MGGRILCFVLLASLTVSGQVTLKGSVGDRDGERLPLAHIVVFPDSLTTTSNSAGVYTLTLAPGEKLMQVSYVGYKSVNISIKLRIDTVVHMILEPDINELNEVVVKGNRNYQREIFEQNRTSTYVLTAEDITSIPVLGGEADVIKTLQLLPGTVRGVEGTSDLFVRGGSADQNLVLLDGAPVYNTSHLFGFLSVFNPDMLDRVEAINGGFPAEYGGRLSSILDVGTKSSLASETRLSGDIGIIASRLFFEQPLVKEKASVWVGGRRTYIDQVLKVVGEDLPYYFYDLNVKLILQPGPRDNIGISHYGGEDILDWFRDRNNDGDGFTTTFISGNNTQSLQWQHLGRNKWRRDVSLFRTTYEYNIRNAFEENELAARSNILDYGARITYSRDSLWRNGTFKVGGEWTRHAVSPNVVNTAGSVAEILEGSSTEGMKANETALHFQYAFYPTSELSLNAGLRVSAGLVRGKQYMFPEPRFSTRYAIGRHEAIKLSYSRMAQYIHRISNSAVTSPTDIWYPVTRAIRPQSSHQVSLAYQRNIPYHGVYLSLEGYGKTMRNLIGFEEGTNLFFNTDFASRLIQGTGRSYGLEALVRKNEGKLTGWLSYTLSWAWRRFDEINQGDWFPSRYDRRHNGAIVLQYKMSRRLSASLVWEYISGARFTPVTGQYVLLSPSLSGVDLIPVYSGINAVKLADAHRLDLGVRFRSKPQRRYQWHWFAGVYNVYNRASPVGINIEQDETDGSLRYEQPGLFGLLPFVSYGFKL
jgi:hypothetical protein